MSFQRPDNQYFIFLQSIRQRDGALSVLDIGLLTPMQRIWLASFAALVLKANKNEFADPLARNDPKNTHKTPIYAPIEWLHNFWLQ